MKRLNRYEVRIGETIATLIAEPQFVPLAEHTVVETRESIKDYIHTNPEFQTSLDPLSVSSDAPVIVQRMAKAGKSVNVGPMAAVAGAIAQHVVEELIAEGADHVVFDNGGDIALYLNEPVVVGLYAGKNGIQGLGLKVVRRHELLGICTSSFSVGHSLSFGKTDVSTIVSNNVALADAAATALGNKVCNESYEEIERALNGLNKEGLEGMLVMIGDLIGVSGDLPEIVRAELCYDLISRGEGVEY